MMTKHSGIRKLGIHDMILLRSTSKLSRSRRRRTYCCLPKFSQSLKYQSGVVGSFDIGIIEHDLIMRPAYIVPSMSKSHPVKMGEPSSQHDRFALMPWTLFDRSGWDEATNTSVSSTLSLVFEFRCLCPI